MEVVIVEEDGGRVGGRGEGMQGSRKEVVAQPPVGRRRCNEDQCGWLGSLVELQNQVLEIVPEGEAM